MSTESKFLEIKLNTGFPSSAIEIYHAMISIDWGLTKVATGIDADDTSNYAGLRVDSDYYSDPSYLKLILKSGAPFYFQMTGRKILTESQSSAASTAQTNATFRTNLPTTQTLAGFRNTLTTYPNEARFQLKLAQDGGKWKVRATINSCTLNIKYLDSDMKVKDHIVKIGTGNNYTVTGNNKAKSSYVPYWDENDGVTRPITNPNTTTNSWETYGGPSDKWGISDSVLTPSFVNDLKLVTSYKGDSGNNANTTIGQVSVRANVYYHTNDGEQVVINIDSGSFVRPWVYNDITGSDVNVKLSVRTPVGVSTLNNNQINIHKVEMRPRYTYGIVVPGPAWLTDYTEQLYGSPQDAWNLPVFTNVQSNDSNFNVKLENTYTSSVAEGIVGTVKDVQMKVFYKTVSSTDITIQDYLPRGVEDHRYAGSKMTSADFNEPSTDTIDGGPVVELTKNINFTDE
jgi:hypothetical protein